MSSKTLISAILTFVMIGGVLLTAGCTGTTTNNETQQITVMMPWTPAISFAPYYVAIEKGYYANEGLNVTIQYTTEGSTGPIKQVGSGNIEFGHACGDSLLIARSEGVPVVNVYQYEQTWPYYVMAENSTGIKNPEDLVGKTIAIVAPGTPTDSTARAELLNSGINPEVAEYIPVGGQLISAMLQGQTDAISGHLLHKYILQSSGINFTVMPAEDYGVDFVGNGIVTNEKTISENPELIEKFVRATNKGAQYAIEHPEETVDIYIKFDPTAAEARDFNLGYWEAFINEAIVPDEKPLGLGYQDRWNLMQDQLFTLGLLKEKTDVTQAFTNAFVPTEG